MLKTSNYNLNKLETNDIVDFDVLNENADILDAELKKVFDKANYIQIAAGSATAITLNNVTLANGFTVTFVVAANNNGTATTINGKNLYKPGGTAAPKLIAGRAVTVWYNGTHFFIKASALGNATADKVLAPFTVSTDDDIDIVGTMPDNGPASAETTSLTSQNQEYIITKGFHSGLRKIKAVISGLTANVIKAGTTVGGILGTFTSDANAASGDILAGKTAYVNGAKITGNIRDLRNTTQEGAYAIGQVSEEYTDIGVYDHATGSNYLWVKTRPRTSGNTDETTAIHTWIANLTKAKIQAGVTIGPAGGGQVTGTYTSDANAVAGDILSGKTAYVNGAKLIGSAILGKKFATGVCARGGILVYTKSNGSTASQGSISFSGLTFTPSLIIAYSTYSTNVMYLTIYNANGWDNSAYPDTKIFNYNTYFNDASSTDMRYGYKLDGTNAYVTSTGFRLPMATSGSNNIVFYAFE